MPDISIIISAYNAKQFIRHKINNILQSIDIDFEIIIIDCNNGENISLIKDIIDEKFTTIIINKRISLWKAMNIGIMCSSTPIIVQANTDDLVSPNAYKLQLDEINNGADIVYFDYYISDGFKETYENGVKEAYSYYHCSDNGYSLGNGLGPFPMWKKELHDKVGLFNDRLEIFGDSLFWTKLAEISTNWKRIPNKLGIYAQRPGQNLESNLKLKSNDLIILEQLREST